MKKKLEKKRAYLVWDSNKYGTFIGNVNEMIKKEKLYNK